MRCFSISVLNRTYRLTFTEKRYTITLTNKPISIKVSCFSADQSGIFDRTFDNSFN